MQSLYALQSKKSTTKHNAKILCDVVTMRAVNGIHTGVVDLMEIQSLGKIRYFVTALDEHTGQQIVRFFQARSETAQTVLQMIREIENLLTSKTSTVISTNQDVLKRLRSNGDGECVRYLFQIGCNRKHLYTRCQLRIQRKTIGASESQSKSLMDMTRALVIAFFLSRQTLLAEAVITARFRKHRVNI